MTTETVPAADAAAVPFVALDDKVRVDPDEVGAVVADGADDCRVYLRGAGGPWYLVVSRPLHQVVRDLEEARASRSRSREKSSSKTAPSRPLIAGPAAL